MRVAALVAAALVALVAWLAPAAAWIEQYRAMWEAQLDRLGAHLKAVTALKQKARKTTSRGATTKRAPRRRAP